jgi:hypothetical protein
MKARRLAGIIGIATLAVGLLVAAGCASSQAGGSTTTAAQSATTQSVGGQSGTTATQSSSTESTMAGSSSTLVLPVPKNPIVNTATKDGLQITSAMAENNVDPVTKKDLADRIQFTLKNMSTEKLSDVEVYYQMTDSTTKKTEGYYQKLAGFSLAPGAEATVYFDNESGPGHYPENAFSIYRTSSNEVVISIEVSAAGYKPVTTQVTKAVGTGENPNE